MVKSFNLQEIIALHKIYVETDGMEGRCADIQGADLTNANLTEANLQGADLTNANLRYANLTDADLTNANLQGADLTEAILTDADLTNANLQGAVLTNADLQGAILTNANLRYTNLTGADLDFSAWPLWCGSLAVKVDKRIAVQLCYHFCALDCDDPEYQKARAKVLDFANQIHRTDVNKMEY